MRASGTIEALESSGLPFGMMEDADYEEMAAQFDEGDCLLFFSDGAVEVHNAQGELLGHRGTCPHPSRAAGYPACGLQISAIEEQLLLYSNDIRLTDDLTFIEVRFLTPQMLSEQGRQTKMTGSRLRGVRLPGGRMLSRSRAAGRPPPKKSLYGRFAAFKVGDVKAIARPGVSRQGKGQGRSRPLLPRVGAADRVAGRRGQPR